MSNLHMLRAIGLSSLLVGFLLSTSHAAVVYDESVSGDLSNSQTAPTAVTLSAGINSVLGNANGSAGDSQDWIALTIPAGFQLSSDVLESYQSTDTQGFTGLQAGSNFVGSPFVAGSYLGYAHFGSAASNGPTLPANVIGLNLLPSMGDNVNVSPGSLGFIAPLSSGTYTFLIQQLGASTAYQFDFGVTAVPEPATIGLIASAAMLALRRRSRRA